MTPTDATTLRALLTNQPVAALATLHRGGPAVSMVPFALLAGGAGLVVHVSRLATHTQDMLDHPGVALLVTGTLKDGDSPLALPRVSIQGHARPRPADAPGYAEARQAYLTKLPDAEPLFDFGDFSLFVIEPESLRFVAGFGRAMAFKEERLREVLADSSA